MSDNVNHPKHYTAHASGIECIQITEHMSFNLGNAVKYIWRADLKHDAIEDLKKAAWYLQREIEKREKSNIKTGAIGSGVPSQLNQQSNLDMIPFGYKSLSAVLEESKRRDLYKETLLNRNNI